jgi:hypothetical protein
MTPLRSRISRDEPGNLMLNGRSGCFYSRPGVISKNIGLTAVPMTAARKQVLRPLRGHQDDRAASYVTPSPIAS